MVLIFRFHVSVAVSIILAALVIALIYTSSIFKNNATTTTTTATINATSTTAATHATTTTSYDDIKTSTTSQDREDADDANGCKTFLWRVEKKHYLFGIINMKTEYLWDAVPNIVKRAFFQSDSVYLNTKSVCQNDEERSPILAYTILRSNLYQRIKRFFHMIQNKKMGADFGDHIYNWQMLSIEEIAAIVSYIPITAVDRSVADLIHVEDCSNGDTCKNGFEKDNIIENIQKTLDQHLDKDVFMDAYIRQAAVYMGKTVGGIETLTEKCDLVKGKPLNLTIFSIQNSLNKYENFNGNVLEFRNFANNIINDVRCVSGNFTLDSLIQDVENNTEIQDKEIGKEYYSYLLNFHQEMNMRKADRIATLIRTNSEKLFFTSAIAHFFGENNVVQLLQEKGFHVERLDALDYI